MLFFTKVWAWLKKYWGFLAVIVGAAVGWVLYSQAKSTFLDDLDAVKKAHEDEVARIKAAQEKRDEAHRQNVAKLEEDLKKINDEYAVSLEELKKKNQKAVETLSKEYKDDPVGLAKLLAERTGATVVVPPPDRK